MGPARQRKEAAAAVLGRTGMACWAAAQKWATGAEKQQDGCGGKERDGEELGLTPSSAHVGGEGGKKKETGLWPRQREENFLLFFFQILFLFLNQNKFKYEPNQV